MEKADVSFTTRPVAGHGASGEGRTWTAQVLPVRSVDEDEFDVDSNTDTIKRIGKLYDVSAVSIPANPGTDIAARALDGEIPGAWAERLSKRRKLAILKARMRILNLELTERTKP